MKRFFSLMSFMAVLATLLSLAFAGCEPAESAVIECAQTESTVEVTVDARPVLRYHLQTIVPPEGIPELYTASGFFHPLFSPSGKVLSDDFPQGHAHQNGLFHAYRRVAFKGAEIDFWNRHKGTGFTRHERFLGWLEKADLRGFQFERIEESVAHGPLITETWEVWVHPRGGPFVVDLMISQQALEPGIVLLKANYSGLAFRGSALWNHDDADAFTMPMEFLTPAGSDRPSINHTRPGWVAAYGPIDGASAGMALLEHPSNPRAPKPVRIHPEMPYFAFGVVLDESIPLPIGKTLVDRYRLLLYDGEPDPAMIEALGFDRLPFAGGD